MTELPADSCNGAVVPSTVGLATLAQRIFDGTGLQSTWNDLQARVQSDLDPGALYDMSMVLQLSGQADAGRELQAAALGLSRCFRRVFGTGEGLRVLALMTPGDFMANTPLDFLFAGSDATLDYLYVTTDSPLPAAVPAHDVAFFAIGESTANQEVLAVMQPVAQAWPRPLVNAHPDRIAALTRDGVCAVCAHVPSILSPATARAARADLDAIAAGQMALGDCLDDGVFPVIVRPIDSHAGQALLKIDDRAELTSYLEQNPQQDFYVAQFIDYSNADGLFRKQRIAFVDGRPFISHLAVSEHWMVHYLNASMAERPERRAEEASFMADFDTGFARRHAPAFAALHRAFGLDYFAIDCAESPDGRLLLFEADVAMIVHTMDSENLFPYKRAPMRKLFEAFQGYLAGRAQLAAQAA